ncbi:MAG: hypothetical protein IH878_14315 [Gemmatimonadetes bacterium]|nr:hypothetical protein [Gemmatimonadota bacterium]
MLIGENQKEPENAKAGYCAHGGQSICTLESQPRRIGILRMTDFQDLQTRAGQVEQAICELDDEHRDLLNGLQNGLNIAREKLIRKKFETDRLTEENNELRQLIERLLDSVESKPMNALHDKLKDLDVQLNVLLDISEDDTALGQVGEDPAEASQSSNADGGSDEPADIVAPEPSGSLLGESSSLHDIETRVRDLSCKIAECGENTKNLPSEPEPHRPEPEPIDREQPGEPYSNSTSENQAVRAPVKETQGVRHADNRNERTAFDRLIETSVETVRRVLPKTRMRFDAEVEYALGVLQQMIRGNRFFSVEEVRCLINGKFGLDLTAQHDGQIAANLSKRDNVTPTAKQGTTWKFGSTT